MGPPRWWAHPRPRSPTHPGRRCRWTAFSACPPRALEPVGAGVASAPHPEEFCNESRALTLPDSSGGLDVPLCKQAPARTRLFLIRGHREGAQSHVPMILTPQRRPPRARLRPHPGTQREALTAGPAEWVLFVGSTCCVPSGFTHLPRDLHPLRTLGRMDDDG